MAHGLHHRIRRPDPHHRRLPPLSALHLQEPCASLSFPKALHGHDCAAFHQARIRNYICSQVLSVDYAFQQYLQELVSLLGHQRCQLGLLGLFPRLLRRDIYTCHEVHGHRWRGLIRLR